MLVSCICVCHNKPDFTHEAIQSVVDQSYPHWEAIVVDSGVLYDAGYYDHFAWRHDKRLRLIRSDETDEIRRSKAMAPWCYNECFRKGWVSGELVMYLCDDDILYANAFATFVSYCRQNPHAKAMYASQDIAVIYPNGWRAIIGERRATQPGGRSCNGTRMDCHVDYLQFCHKAEVLPLLAPNEYWPEGKDTESHADGIFMERVGEHVTIHAIDVKVSQNRRTPQSAYVPVGPLSMIECMANGAPCLAPEAATGRSVERRAWSAERGAQSAIAGSGMCAPRSALCAPRSGTKDAPLVTISIAFRDQGTSLPDTLASLEAQTYPHIEVLVIDDGSMDVELARVFEAMKSRYPRFRFLDQTCVESGVRRHHGLWAARGVYFIPMVAGTLACPHMVERFVAGMRRNVDLSALTCYLLALREDQEPSSAYDFLASTKNIYSGGIFHTANFRKVGGYGTDREIAGQDWIGFLRLVNNGYPVDILLEHLFYYRPLANGSIRTQDDSQRRERVLRPFLQADRLLAGERVAVWTAFADMQRRVEQLAAQNQALQEQNQALQTRCGALRYRVADRLTLVCDRVPFAKRTLHWLLGCTGLPRKR